jgi:molecular chaperone Hsp33
MAKNTVESLRKQFKTRDRVTRVLTKDGFFRAAALHNTHVVQTAEAKHELEPLAAVLLGRLLSAATLLASFLKSEERIILEAMGAGPLKRIYAEAMELGEVRGYAQEPLAAIDWSKPNTTLGDALGAGLLRVVKILYTEREPIEGIVELRYGDISSDVAFYLTQSEQIPSALILDVSLNNEGKVDSSAGILVQAMPGASKEAIERVLENMRQLTPLTTLSKNEYSSEDMLRMILPDEFDVLNTTQVDFFCRCSKERFINALVTLEKDEIRDMQERQQNELVCRYCNSKYYLEPEDFEQLLQP